VLALGTGFSSTTILKDFKMTHFKLLSGRRIFAITTGVVVLAAASIGGGVAGGLSRSVPPVFPNAGTMTVFAQRLASRREAHEDFFITVGNCLNDPDADVMECVDEAEQEVAAQFARIETQFNARLAIIAKIGDTAYVPDIDPTDFTANVTNPYFPLVPGRTLIYEKVDSDGIEHIEVTTLNQTFIIEGVDCRVVRDVVRQNGVVVEDTIDWFSQDDDGEVWYMGELVQNFEDGLLDNLDGSWRHGKDGAKAGIIMKDEPEVGDAYRLEFYLNEAEDFAEVIGVGETVTVPAGTFTNCIRTRDTTPIEPGNIEEKVYAPGVGLVLEVKPATGERLELIQIVN
jgi:hypothetical protein